MYYPYFRGKQNELITIRDGAKLLSDAKFTPIIEPVKSSLNGLRRALTAVEEADGNVIVIINPYYGDFARDRNAISTFIDNEYSEKDNIMVGILLSKNVSVSELVALFEAHKDKGIAFIHAGFSEAKELTQKLGEQITNIQHIFVEDHCGKLYRRYFRSVSRILIRDGFEKRKNSEYPSVEFFSDLHITYSEEGVVGYGDFLIVADEYSETGGPAYAIAIHLTCIDASKDNEMHVHHFVSDRQDTPTDPAGKFAEALEKLITEINKQDSNFEETGAIREFRDLHRRGHFPGLGYVKKLSMQHHIETLAIFQGA